MKNQYLFIALLFITTCSFAQTNTPGEYIYFTTGTTLKGKVESADDEKIITILESGSRWPGLRDKFMIFFNKSGNYLTEKNIPKDPAKANEVIQNFYTEQKDNKGYNDVIFKAIPREVIACTISNVLDDAVNYVTTDGKSASINRDNIFAMIRRDGSFEIFTDARDISEVSNNLSSMYDDFQKSRLPHAVKPPVTDVLKPTVKPAQPFPVAENKPESRPETKESKKLTAEDQKVYKAKSIEKMKELEKLLNSIVDIHSSRTEKDLAIKKAVKMFVSGSRVEVSAVNNPNSKTNREIEEYLGRLSRLNYSKVNITYAEINFIDEFIPDNLGNYWGMASYIQTFETKTFRDLTPKIQKIKLQQYEKIVDGTTEDKFEILLGNISINVSQ